MVMKRGVALLALAAVASMATVEASQPIKVATSLKHPVVKSATEKDGKIRLVLEEGTVTKKHHVKGGSVVSKSHHKVHAKADENNPPDVEDPESKKFHKFHKKHVKADENNPPDVEDPESKKLHKKSHKHVKADENNPPDVEDPESKKFHKFHKKSHKKHVKADENNPPDVEDPESKSHKKTHKKEKTEFPHGNVEISNGESGGEADSEEKPAEEKPAESRRKHHHKKAHGHKQVSEEKKPDGELVRKYPHGSVYVKANDKPAEDKAVSKHHKKAHKTHNAVVEKPKDDDVDEKDVTLEEGETVTLTFGDHEVEVTLMKNGSLLVEADGESYVLPSATDLDIDFSGSFEGEFDGSIENELLGSEEGEEGEEAGSLDEESESFVEKVEDDISGVAKKFTEYATKLVGDNKLFTAESAPIVFACGVLGALAAVVGIAALAMGRARDAAADPQSVLSDVTDIDVEAGVTAATEEEATEDAAADDSESLDGSESESDNEEGTFTNEVASV
ncbi:hypothetical protein PINS_up001770 [Pythium insidiosum]|nr:hypothetical protein PINS_up001770 [Pythium insidiosum]